MFLDNPALGPFVFDPRACRESDTFVVSHHGTSFPRTFFPFLSLIFITERMSGHPRAIRLNPR
jgi:hypothetical protein